MSEDNDWEVSDFEEPEDRYPIVISSVIQKLVDEGSTFENASSYMDGWPEEDIRDVLEHTENNVEESVEMILGVINDLTHEQFGHEINEGRISESFEDDLDDVDGFEKPHRLMDKEVDAPLSEVESLACEMAAKKWGLPLEELLQFVEDSWSGAETLDIYRTAEAVSETLEDALNLAAKKLLSRFAYCDGFDERFGEDYKWD